MTQTADVEVNSASRGDVQIPAADDIGSANSTAPTAMTIAKPETRTADGERGRRTRRGGAIWNSMGRARSTRTRRSPGRRPLSVIGSRIGIGRGATPPQSSNPGGNKRAARAVWPGRS